MSGYGNVNTKELKSSLNRLDNISSEKIDSLTSKMTYSEWNGPVRGRVITAMNAIVKEIGQIKKDISNYKNASEQIKKYNDYNDDYNYYNEKVIEYQRKYRECNPEDKTKKKYYLDKVTTHTKNRDNAKSNRDKASSDINYMLSK